MQTMHTPTRAGSTTPVAPPAPSRVRIMTALVWLTTLAIFCQAIIAGQFVSREGKDGWVTLHGVVADVSWVLALVSAAYAFFALRQHFPLLMRWTAVLFVTDLIQTGLGHLITDKGMDWLIPIHVPLAFVVFAAAGYLSVWAVRVRHQADQGHLEHAAAIGADAQADVHDVVRPPTSLPTDAP